MILISAFFGFLIYILLPINKDKYKTDIINHNASEETYAYFPVDLDGRNGAEIVSFLTSCGYSSMLFWSESGKVLGQVNYKGEWIERAEKSVYDLDRDGNLEVMGFFMVRGFHMAGD